ncbi:hypothetical protein AB9K34_22915 [Sedimentitalea sp. XS_ASV28]|uniref:hypothetical protein n=1 Tax=Sedimentitalea sp. XS_ASV28 TaxID=3241296 RepID=UPI003514FE87
MRETVAICVLVGRVSACGKASPDLAERGSARNAGATEVAARERQIEASDARLNRVPNPASPGCQQGFEGEVACI